MWKGREVAGLLLAFGGFIAVFPLLGPAAGCPVYDRDPLCDDTFERCRRLVGHGCAGTPLQAMGQAALLASVVACAAGIGLIAWYARDLRTGRYYAD